MPLKTYRLPALSNAAPEGVVIILHGLGDSGSGGLLEIGRIWQRTLPNIEFLCPDAPFPYDMAPADFGGRQWFSLREFTKQSVEAGVKNAAPFLDAYIDEVLAARHLKPSQLALVGFSQGTMMSLHVALRRPQQIACIIGYSGMLAEGEHLNAEKKSAPPTLLIHGTADEVVPFAAMDAAERILRSAGIPVQTLTCPGLGHSIDDAGIIKGMEFLQDHFHAVLS